MIINRIYETKSSAAVACFLPGRAKDLSAPLLGNKWLPLLTCSNCTYIKYIPHSGNVQRYIRVARTGEYPYCEHNPRPLRHCVQMSLGRFALRRIYQRYGTITDIDPSVHRYARQGCVTSKPNSCSLDGGNSLNITLPTNALIVCHLF